ncbi:MAG: hypothetical protein JXQ90_02530 [Cyclobacteriaceae bacterium]
MKRLIPIFLVLLMSMPVFAQLSLVGEVRPRSEFRNGFKTLADGTVDPAFFTEQRSRIYVGFKAEKYQLKITLQDIRIWGANDQIHKADNGMSNINEAWGQVELASNVNIRVGRQIISYDNQRFLGGLEWAQQGRRHDAAVFLYENQDNQLKVHVGLAYNQDGITPEPRKIFGTTYAANNYKAMQYLWAHKDFEGGGVSALLFNESRQYGALLDGLSQRQTFGLVGSYKIGEIVAAGEGYYQGGSFQGVDVSAFMFDLNATYKLSSFPITGGYQYLSGSDIGATQINHFTPAFGTNHAHNGFMDYFYVGNAHGNVGLQDIYLKTKINTGEKGNILIWGHQFLSAVDVPTAGAALGTEIDVVFTYKMAPAVTLNAGYSQLFATETMEILKGGDRSDLQNWAFVMLTIKPTLYTGE